MADESFAVIRMFDYESNPHTRILGIEFVYLDSYTGDVLSGVRYLLYINSSIGNFTAEDVCCMSAFIRRSDPEEIQQMSEPEELQLCAGNDRMVLFHLDVVPDIQHTVEDVETEDGPGKKITFVIADAGFVDFFIIDNGFDKLDLEAASTVHEDVIN